MTRKLILAAALAAMCAVPAAAEQAGKANGDNAQPKACLQIGRIWSWNAPDNRTLIVENDTHQKFKVDLMGFCPGLTFKQTLAFKSIGGMSLSCITPGDIVFFHDIGMETRCVISKVTAYTPEMEKADKAAKAAKEKKD